MTLNSGAVLDALVTMLGSTTGVQHVYRGVPESMDSRLCAWVALAGQQVGSEEFEVEDIQLLRESRFLVAFGYRVSGNEGAAEDALADAIDSFLLTFYRNRRTGTGVFAVGTTGVEDGDINLGIADSPEYAVYAGQENRIYPVLVSAVQRELA